MGSIWNSGEPGQTYTGRKWYGRVYDGGKSGICLGKRGSCHKAALYLSENYDIEEMGNFVRALAIVGAGHIAINGSVKMLKSHMGIKSIEVDISISEMDR